MRRTLEVLLVVLELTLLTFAQDGVPTFRTEATNVFVWGEDNRSGAVSSTIRDPVTGHQIHKLNHAGVEVSSRAGFERVGSGEAGELLSFATTIVNTTGSEVSVRLGGASVEGQAALPLSVVQTKKGLNKSGCFVSPATFVPWSMKTNGVKIKPVFAPRISPSESLPFGKKTAQRKTIW